MNEKPSTGHISSIVSTFNLLAIRKILNISLSFKNARLDLQRLFEPGLVVVLSVVMKQWNVFAIEIQWLTACHSLSRFSPYWCNVADSQLTDRSHPSNPSLQLPGPPAVAWPYHHPSALLSQASSPLLFSFLLVFQSPFFPFRSSYLHLFSLFSFSPSCSIY